MTEAASYDTSLVLFPTTLASSMGMDQIRLSRTDATSMDKMEWIHENSVLASVELYQNWTDDRIHELELVYHSFGCLQVFVDHSLYLSKCTTLDLSSTDRFVGWMTISTGLVIHTFAVITNQLVTENSVLEQSPGSALDLKLSTKDACNETYPFGGFVTFIRTKVIRNEVQRRMLQQSAADVKVVDNGDGTYSISFGTLGVGNYTVYLGFGSTCQWRLDDRGYTGKGCWSVANQVVVNPIESTPYVFPFWYIVIVIALATLALVVVLIRRRMTHHDEDSLGPHNGDYESKLLAMMKQQHMSEYEMNQLKAEIDRLRMEKNGEFESMEMDQAELLDVIKYLKQRLQEEESFRQTASRNEAPGGRKKIEFKPEKVAEDKLTELDLFEVVKPT